MRRYIFSNFCLVIKPNRSCSNKVLADSTTLPSTSWSVTVWLDREPHPRTYIHMLRQCLAFPIRSLFSPSSSFFVFSTPRFYMECIVGWTYKYIELPRHVQNGTRGIFSSFLIVYVGLSSTPLFGRLLLVVKVSDKEVYVRYFY